MYADYHLHSEFSDDSKELMERQVEKAIKLGLDEICFTDHVDYGIKRDWDDPRGIEWRQGDGISSGDAAREPLANVDYPRYFAKIACIRAAYGDAIKIRSGLEFGIQSITVDDYERLFAKYQDELDFVLFSMHQVDNKEFWTYLADHIKDAYAILRDEIGFTEIATFEHMQPIFHKLR
jgi:histidinol-phosphatase (PHP family)